MTMITVEFMTQVKAEAGCARMDLDASRAMPVSSVLGAVIERMPTLQSLLVDEEGGRHGWLMVSIDDVLIPRDHDPEVPLGSRVLLATPISGG